jgi:lysine biosynthesis protein LysW
MKAKVKGKTKTAPCPDCEAGVDLGPWPKEGQEVICMNCGVLLEVVSLEPLILDWAIGDYDDDLWPDDEED